YVWSAIGLYPQFPAVRALDIGAPLFSHVAIHTPHGPTIVIDAPGAGGLAHFIAALRVNGATAQHTWIALPLHGTVHLAFDLALQPNQRWGTDDGDAIPAFASSRAAFPASTPVRIKLDPSTVELAPGSTNGTVVATFANSGTTARTITWRVREQPGLSVSPAAGVVHLGTMRTAPVSLTIATATSGLYNVHLTAVDDNGAQLEPITVDVLARADQEQLPLAWIANRFDDTVMPYDPRTGALGAPIAVKDEPRDGVLSRDGRLYFIADRGAKTISVIDTVRNAVIADIAVGNSPNGLAIAPDGSTVWVANYDDGTLQSIDVRTLRVSKPLHVGTGPRYIAIAPDGSHLYVTLQGTNLVEPVDLREASAPSALAPIPVGERPTGLALSPDGRTLYVVNNGSNDVSVVNLATKQTIARVAAGIEPNYISVNPSGTLAYVTNYATTTVTPIDLTTNTAKPAITVGGQPFDVEWLRDGSGAIAILHRDNALVRIDRDGHVTSSLFLGSGGAYTIALPH
ncbi:MAG TPA: beta-propeller fold lactonase family protein, partial [Verrucomicrobiae bacterium]|nr:beta-propeller fold lactonase family protein [Verrucomicrobiae bacterium]